MSAPDSPPPEYVALMVSPLPRASEDSQDDDDESSDRQLADSEGAVNEPLLPKYTTREVDEEAAMEDVQRRTGRLIKLVLLALLSVFAAVGGLLLLRLARIESLEQTVDPLPTSFSPSFDILTPSHETIAERPPLPPSSISLLLQNSTALALLPPGQLPFSPTPYSPLLPRHSPLLPTLSQRSSLSTRCLGEFVSQGRLCAGASIEEEKLDVMWTWVNGSDAEPLAAWREKVSAEVGEARLRRRWTKMKRWIRRKLGGDMRKHFREHDELRFSLRSVLNSLPSSSLGSLHLIVNDSPAHDPSDSSSTTMELIAQIPHWLNRSTARFSEPNSLSNDSASELWIHPLTELYRTPVKGYEHELSSVSDEENDLPRKAGYMAALEESLSWRDSVLPSFNSLAVESQLASLPSTDSSSDMLLALNDDYFLLSSISVADIASPLTGPLFRMQRDLMVTGVAPDKTHDDGDGEWRGLGYSAWLLDQRFGQRARPYVVHEAKSVSRAMLTEVQSVWMEELTATAGARFRGKAPLEVELWFLLYHYTMEKHREALLWSFLIARSDKDHDGLYSSEEQSSLLSDLGYDPSTSSTTLAAATPHRSTLASLLSSFSTLKLAPPTASSFDFSSWDGYSLFTPDTSIHSPWPSFASPPSDHTPPCTIDLEVCFPEFLPSPDEDGSDVSVERVFRRVAFEETRCGDCLVAHLVAKSGDKGLEAFLPSAEEQEEEEQNERVVVALAPRIKAFNDADASFAGPTPHTSQSYRSQAISLITRYTYTVASSSARFISLKRPGSSLSQQLEGIEVDRPTFVAVNDDVAEGEEEVDRQVKEWFEKMWSEKSCWEL